MSSTLRQATAFSPSERAAIFGAAPQLAGPGTGHRSSRGEVEHRDGAAGRARRRERVSTHRRRASDVSDPVHGEEMRDDSLFVPVCRKVLVHQ